MGSTKNADADLRAVVEKLQEDNKKITQRLYEAEHIIKSLNIALVGLAYTNEVSPERIQKADANTFLKFIESNVHPIIRRADELTGEVAESAKRDVAKQAKESQRESK